MDSIRERDPNSRLELTLAGGGSLIALAVKLYPVVQLMAWRRMLATAQHQLGGVSTGLGFIGSPGWVIGASVALGVLESMASSKAAKEGRKTLEMAEKAFEQIRRNGQLFPVSEIQNLDLPQPTAWSATRDGKDFAILNEDFIGLEDDSGSAAQVRWACVAAYRALIDGAAAEPLPRDDISLRPATSAAQLGWSIR